MSKDPPTVEMISDGEDIFVVVNSVKDPNHVVPPRPTSALHVRRFLNEATPVPSQSMLSLSTGGIANGKHEPQNVRASFVGLQINT